MNRIRLTWSRCHPDSEILSLTAEGITHAQLRHHAQRVGFLDFRNDDGDPVLLGTYAQHDDLYAVIEAAGYEIDSEAVIRVAAA